MSRAQLDDERDFLLSSLRDLDQERAAGDISEDDYRELHDRYTVRAASVLRALDTGITPAAPASAPRSWARTAAMIVIVGAVAVGAGAVVTSSSGERLASDQISGEVTQGVTGKLARAQELIAAGKPAEAVELYDEILAEDPDQPEALAYRGWILHLARLSDRALIYLDRAVAADPAYADAHFFRGMVLWKGKGDVAGAVTEFRLFLDNNPPPAIVPAVKEALAQAEAEASGSTTTTAPG